MTAELLMKIDLPDFMFNPACKEGLTLEDSGPGLILKIKPKRPDEDGFGNRLGVVASLAQNLATDEEQICWIGALIENRIPQSGTTAFNLPFEQHGKLVVDSDGVIQPGQTFWFEWLPPDLRELVDRTADEMWNALTRCIGLLSWGQNEPIPSPQRTPFSLYWRVQRDTLYYLLPQRGYSQSARACGGFGWAESDRATHYALWKQAGLNVPLAHELRNEALLARDATPRSALLLCASALEVGVKTHVASIAPATDWLLKRLPSPPVPRILREYLPLLQASQPRNLNWEALKPLFTLCQRMIEDRNSLAHSGVTPDLDVLDRYHDATGDVLYILDYLAGHDWAQSLVRSATRRALGWSATDTRRRFGTIRIKTGPSI